MQLRWTSIVVSLLLATSGWVGSKTLVHVDQDLRVIYTEYTLTATDLGHLNGELIRYRTSVIRAIETDAKEEFERIVVSLPEKRAHIEEAIDRFIAATNDASFGRRLNERELSELEILKERISSYMTSSRKALEIMQKRWNANSAFEATRLRDGAKDYLADDASVKYMNVTIELDRLLEVVASVAGDVKKEADLTLRIVTAVLILASIVLSALVLVVG
jgi:chemoreceptor-like protein with four helix bundle sensory module